VSISQTDLVGRWAVCGAGRIGRIEGRKELAWGVSWVGTGLDGRPWASRNPRLVCEEEASAITALAESCQTSK